MAISSFQKLPSNEAKAFLTAIHEDFDNDDPRLVFADWLEEHDDPRGEFFRMQCNYEKLPKDDDSREDLRTEIEDWQAKYGPIWEEELGVKASSYDRGLPTIGHPDFSIISSGIDAPLSVALEIGWVGRLWIRASRAEDLMAFHQPPLSTTAVSIILQIDSTQSPPDSGSLDEAMQWLQGSKQILALNLHATNLSNSGLRSFRNMPRLRYLILRGQEITNQGMEYLVNLPSLQVLILCSTSVTSEGVNCLKERYPHIRVLNC
jgi:uncharacterized protein (TIGR02996 family)